MIGIVLTIYKTLRALAKPVVQSIGQRYWMIIGAGVALIIFPLIANHKGRKDVVSEVAVQAGEIKTKDANENLSLAVEGAKIQARLEQSSNEFETQSNKQFEEMKKGSLNVEFESDAVDWANQPVPMSVRVQINGNGH